IPGGCRRLWANNRSMRSLDTPIPPDDSRRDSSPDHLASHLTDNAGYCPHDYQVEAPEADPEPDEVVPFPDLDSQPDPDDGLEVPRAVASEGVGGSQPDQDLAGATNGIDVPS